MRNTCTQSHHRSIPSHDKFKHFIHSSNVSAWALFLVSSTVQCTQQFGVNQESRSGFPINQYSPIHTIQLSTFSQHSGVDIRNHSIVTLYMSDHVLLSLKYLRVSTGFQFVNSVPPFGSVNVYALQHYLNAKSIPTPHNVVSIVCTDATLSDYCCNAKLLLPFFIWIVTRHSYSNVSPYSFHAAYIRHRWFHLPRKKMGKQRVYAPRLNHTIVIRVN